MAETLTNVAQIDQGTLLKLYDHTIKNGECLIVHGPSGSGKTEMAMQAIKRNGCRPIYINLSVMERPDIQGWPKISQDNIEAEYAVPHFLPVDETRFLHEKKSLENVKAYLEAGSEALINIEKRLAEIREYEKCLALNKALPFVKKFMNKEDVEKHFINTINYINNTYGKSEEIVILFDELDKAPKEVLQPLLEILQLRTLNGRPLNVKACLMTANLPDENAHTENLSHAITNRCFIYKLFLDFDCWRDWAVANKVHPLVVGFLSSHKDYLHKKASNHDDTAYAYCSPRSWVSASKALYAVEHDSNSKTMSEEEKIAYMVTLISGKVGSDAASKFELWLKYYHKLDPIINNIVETGKMLDAFGKPCSIDDMELDEKLVCAISACSRVNHELRPDNTEELTRVVTNIFTWLLTIDSETQIAAVRNTLDQELVKQYNLSKIPEFMEVFKNLNKIKHSED